MTNDLTHAERAEALLNQPERYEELVEAYQNGKEFYEKTREKIPNVASDFEEYLSFYRIFINRGPSEYIYSLLNKNTDRSIKNMILGSSDAGRAFRIYTLEQAEQRVKSYQGLGVEGTSLHGVITTVLEEIYESGDYEKYGYSILSTLLNGVPSSERDTVELVARARFVAAIQLGSNEQRISEKLNNYLNVVGDPLTKDSRTAEEILDDINNRSYGDPELVELYEAALHRDKSIRLLSDYLYFSGRDIVERYRHQGRREPTVAELHLSKRQLKSIQELPVGRNLEQEAYIQSYHHLAQGLYESGREYRSKQDPRKVKSSNFMRGAQEYLRAAAAIESWNNVRFVKYLNKAFRHAANATDSWQGKATLHDCAIVTITEVGQQFDDEEAVEAVTESKQLQRFWSQVAKSHAYLLQLNPDQAHESAVAANEQFQDIDINISSFPLQRCLTLSEGLLLEDEEEYELAVSCYDELSLYDKMVESRKNLAQISSHIQNDNQMGALDLAISEFGEGSLITNALRAISEENIITQRSHGTLPDDLVVGDAEANEWRLQSLLSLYVATDEFEDIFRRHIRLALKDL